VARDYLFALDRQDYRDGVITTDPMVSAQWFEPWRRDTQTFYDLTESSIATIRRSIRFEFTRKGENTWTVSPKVLVERQVLAERRITSAVLYRSAFRDRSRDPNVAGSSAGSREADAGIILPRRYWYPLRRDANFERTIANAVETRLKR
jgi:hypothetical protein